MAERQITIKFLRGGKYQTEPLRGIKGKEILVEEGEIYTGPYEFGYKMVEARAAEEVIVDKNAPDATEDTVKTFLDNIVKNADNDEAAGDAIKDWAEKEHGIDIGKRKSIPKIIEFIIKAIKDDKGSE